MIREILFDLDGTLINSIDDLADCANYILSIHGFETRPNEAYKLMVGDGMRKTLERALGGNADSKTVDMLLSEFTPYYEKHCHDRTVAFDGMKETVAELKKLGMKLCVITNKEQSAAETVLDIIYGKNTFDMIVGQSDAFPRKPQPHSSFYAMSETEVNSDECLFVGDSHVDMMTAENCGAVSVGALWGFRDSEELSKAGARFIIKTPEEIVKLVKEINDV